MGAFNVVHADVACLRCGTESRVGVQFKYGSTWQHEYAIGDALLWGGNDSGTPGHHRVVVDGAVAGPCPSCDFDGDWYAYVQLQDDKIVAVEPATGVHDFVTTQSTFIVLDG